MAFTKASTDLLTADLICFGRFATFLAVFNIFQNVSYLLLSKRSDKILIYRATKCIMGKVPGFKFCNKSLAEIDNDIVKTQWGSFNTKLYFKEDS